MNPAASTDQRVQVVDAEGNPATVPASELEQAQKAGYRAVTDPAELKAIQDKEEYSSGIDHSVQAGLMGLARGLTFGGSDEALIKSGLVSPDTAKNLMEYQPGASTVGKVAGQVLPMLIPGVGEEAGAEELATQGAARAPEAMDALATQVAPKGPLPSPLENFARGTPTSSPEDVQSAIAKTRKLFGDDVTNSILKGEGERGKNVIAGSEPEALTNAKGGSNLYNPEGKMGSAQPVFGPPGSELTPAGAVDPDVVTSAAAPDVSGSAPTPEEPGAFSDFVGNAAKTISAPVRGVATTGEAVQRAVSGTLGPGWLGKIGGAAARGATEGALYGAGDDVTEDAIGNKPLTAESLMATAGAGALFGGALGAGFEGALGLSQKIVPTIMEKTSDRLQKIASKWKSGLPDSAAEIKEFAGDLQKSNDSMIAAHREFLETAKPRYAESVLGDQNRTGDVMNNLVGDIDAKYGARKIQDANAETASAVRAARDAEKASDGFFAKFHGADKYDHFRKLIGGTPVNPNVTYDLERAIGNLAESQYGSATLEKFKQAIGEHLGNLREYSATNEALKDAQAELAELERTGPQQVSAGLNDAEIQKATIDANNLWAKERLQRAEDAWMQKTGGRVQAPQLKADFIKNFGETERQEFVQNYLKEQADKRLAQSVEQNARATAQHEARVKELKRHIDETQAHLQELPNTKNLADQMESLDKLKKKLDQIKRPVLETDRDRLMFEKIVKARAEIRDLLEDEGLFGPAAEYQKEVNKALSRHYVSYGEPSKPGFASSFTNRAGNATEREIGKRLVSGTKMTRFIRALAKGGEETMDAAGHWAAHIQDTTAAAERIAKLTFADNPERAKEAEDLIAKMKMANSKVRTAAEKTAAVREAARAPRAAPLAQSRAVARWGAKLERNLKGATTDAERFNALDAVHTAMSRAKLTPAEEELYKKLGDMLQDTTLFGKAAEMHAASETAFAQAKLARDALEQKFFRKPIGVGENTPQVKTSSVEAHVNQFARNQARSADAVNMVDDYVKTSKDALDYVHKEVYPKLTSKKTARSTEAFLNKIQEQRAKAAAARRYDIAHPEHGLMEGVAHGGAIAVGLRALGVHGALPAFVLYRVLKNPTQTLHTVGTAAGHAANLVKRLGELSRSVFERAEGKGAALAGPTVSHVLEGTSYGTKPPEKGETRAQAAKRIIDDLTKLAQPDEFQQRMSKALGTLQARAPQTTELVVNRGQRAIDYLLSNAPSAASPDTGLPGQKPWVPSDYDIHQLSQRVRAINDPTVLLQDMRIGKLSASSVEAVKAVYPEIYQATVAGVQEQMMHQTKPLTSIQLQQVSTLFGQPVGAIQRMMPQLQKGATSPLPQPPQLSDATQPPQAKPRGSFAKLDADDRIGTNLSSTAQKE